MSALRIDDEVHAVLSALGILLVFVGALFDISYKQIGMVLDTEVPPIQKPEGRNRLRRRVVRTIASRGLPLTLVTALVAYIESPLAFRILRHSAFSPWNFQPGRTTYIALWLLTVSLTIWSLALVVRLNNLRRKAAQGDDVGSA